jgi:EAL domain-containing protein (putative c-di-GMP-specific phosphodiesterase class I)
MMRVDPDWVADAAREAGLSPRSLTFELYETAIVRGGSEFAERLRAQGWGVALVGDAQCPLPFGKHARALYTEVVLDAPTPIDPYLATQSCDRSPVGRRIYAAKEAGLVVTAREARTDGEAALLALAGFDRAGGPVAAQP